MNFNIQTFIKINCSNIQIVCVKCIVIKKRNNFFIGILISNMNSNTNRNKKIRKWQHELWDTDDIIHKHKRGWMFFVLWSSLTYNRRLTSTSQITGCQWIFVLLKTITDFSHLTYIFNISHHKHQEAFLYEKYQFSF